MKRVFLIEDLKKELSVVNQSPTGFVPTMGALHNGHLSLVSQAIEECPVVVVSIFVNPTQFNDKEDLRNYPRPIEKDLELLACFMRENDIVFTPETKEIYPRKETRIFDFGKLEKVMEGQYRPGHFSGVGQVVSRLFEIVNPDIAYFGQKDFQQVTIIKDLVRQTGSNVKMVVCPIVRESDGLAMSSRNELLPPEIRKEAAIIYQTISTASEMINNKEICEIKEYVKTSINRTPGFSLEYYEIVDDKELIPVMKKQDAVENKKYFACIAVIAGKVRLIDNIEISLL